MLKVCWGTDGEPEHRKRYLKVQTGVSSSVQIVHLSDVTRRPHTVFLTSHFRHPTASILCVSPVCTSSEVHVPPSRALVPTKQSTGSEHLPSSAGNVARGHQREALGSHIRILILQIGTAEWDVKGFEPVVSLATYPKSSAEHGNQGASSGRRTNTASTYPVQNMKTSATGHHRLRTKTLKMSQCRTLASFDACIWPSEGFTPFPTCQIILSGGSCLNGNSPHHNSYHTVLQINRASVFLESYEIIISGRYHTQQSFTKLPPFTQVRKMEKRRYSKPRTSITPDRIRVSTFDFKKSNTRTETSQLREQW